MTWYFWLLFRAEGRKRDRSQRSRAQEEALQVCKLPVPSIAGVSNVTWPLL